MGRGALAQVCTVGDLRVSLSPGGASLCPVGGLCQVEPGEGEYGRGGRGWHYHSRKDVVSRWPEALKTESPWGTSLQESLKVDVLEWVFQEDSPRKP